MSKCAKGWLIAAAVLVILGMALFAGALAAYDGDFFKFSTVTYTTNTYEVEGAFDNISVNVDTTRIELVPTNEESCRIVCTESEKVKHTAVVQNDTLAIETIDTRSWYDHIGIFMKSPQMTVYLPQSEYASLSVETHTGDITIPKDFSFETVKIDGDTSDVKCFASVSDVLEINVSTGDVYIADVTAGRLELSTDTGDIRLNGITVEGDMEIETDTGDVSFEKSDAARIVVETDTGDVVGTLRSEKVFIAETATGKISVPDTAFGGRCEIKTATGDIKIEIQR